MFALVTFFTVIERIFYTYFVGDNFTIILYGNNFIESIMTRRDNSKASLVEFLRSIKFARQKTNAVEASCPTHFAPFNQRARTSGKDAIEDNQLIRSAN